MIQAEKIEQLVMRLRGMDFPYYWYAELIGLIASQKLLPQVLPFISVVGVVENGFIFNFKRLSDGTYIELEYTFNSEQYDQTLKIWESGTFEIFYEMPDGKTEVLEYNNIDKAIEKFHELFSEFNRYQ